MGYFVKPISSQYIYANYLSNRFVVSHMGCQIWIKNPTFEIRFTYESLYSSSKLFINENDKNKDYITDI